MEAPKELKSVSLNVETGELLINGDPARDVSEFCLEFRDGRWELSLQQRNYYTTTSKPVQRSLEERIAGLEEQVQSQLKVDIDVDTIRQALQRIEANRDAKNATFFAKP